jgi:hypothetical protein
MRKTRFIQTVVLVCIGSLAACTSGEDGTVGNTELNVIVPVGSDLSGPGTSPIDIQNVEYTINCDGTPSTFLDDATPLPGDGAVQINGNLEVVDGRTSPTEGIPPEFGTARPGDRSEIWQGFMDLPVGPCTIQLRARDNDGEVICTATESFDIAADTTSKVNLVMICDTSFQAPVGSLDVDATFSFVVGNFCPDLFVLNCNAQDETVEVVDVPGFGPQAPATCEVRFRDVDSTCGQSCDPQDCTETPEGLTCVPGPDPGVSTTVTCVATPAGAAALDCEVDGVPNTECVFTGDALGNVGQPRPGPLNPGPGGFVVGFALCTADIVDGTNPGCGIAFPCPIPVACDDPSKVGSPLFPGATMTCTAVTTDGDEDCDKSKSVTLTGPGLSPCNQVGCFAGEDCAFCDDGITCTENVCDDSSGAPVCPNAPRPAGTDCSVDFGGAEAECDGAGACTLLGCTTDADCPGPDGNCLGQSTCQGDLTCSTPPPANEGGSCDNSGVGSGVGTCSAGTCDSADACLVDGDCGVNPNECLLNQCNTGVAPYVCETVNNDGASCNSGAGVCNGGACELPPICGAFSGSTTWNAVPTTATGCTYDSVNTICTDCTITGPAVPGGGQCAQFGTQVVGGCEVPGGVLNAQLAIDTQILIAVSSTGDGNVDSDVTVTAVNPALSTAAGLVTVDAASIFTSATGTPSQLQNDLNPAFAGQVLGAFTGGGTVLTLDSDAGTGIGVELPVATTAFTPSAPAGGTASFDYDTFSLTLTIVASGTPLIVDDAGCVFDDPGTPFTCTSVAP